MLGNSKAVIEILQARYFVPYDVQLDILMDVFERRINLHVAACVGKSCSSVIVCKLIALLFCGLGLRGGELD